MTCNYSKRQLENGPVSISCTVITFLTAELLPKLEVLGFKCCRLYVHSEIFPNSGGTSSPLRTGRGLNQDIIVPGNSGTDCSVTRAM